MRSAIAVFALAASLAQAGIINRSTIEQCLASRGVPYDRRGTADWERDAAPFNVRVPFTPLAIAVPRTVQHIQNSVNCGRALNIKVSAKSGGHSYGNMGFGGENGHLIVQLDRMYNMTLDPVTKVATVQPGARLGHMATVLYEQYHRSIAHGTCPGVGISGHFAHGGFGFSSHMHGLALDSVVGVSVVLADGRLVEASETRNSDLFWAVKGAGSNFGIVAAWKLATFESPEVLTKLSVALNWNKSTAVAGLEAVEQFAKNTAPRELNFRLGAYASNNIGLEGLYYGTPEQAVAAIQPLLAVAAPNANITEAAEMSWLEMVNAYSFSPAIDVITPSPQENFYSKSLALKGLNGTAAEAFVNYFYDEAIKAVERFWFFQLDIHGGRHSQIAARPFGSTSYAHRDKLYLIQFYDRLDNNTAEWQEPEWFGMLDGWVNGVTSKLPAGSWGAYANYWDAKFSRDEAQRLYYGAHLRQLQRLKAKYDPSELFSTPKSIRPVW